MCQLLHYLYGYRILGLESNEKNVENAKKRQKLFYPNSINHVKYLQCEVNNEFSIDTIHVKLKEEFNDLSFKNEKICLIGLHACADLSVWIMKIFTQLKEARLLILLSCCYHKLSMISSNQISNVDNALNNDGEFFLLFPLSSTLKNVIELTNLNCNFFQRTFLRLACQEPAERWHGMSSKIHENHAFHVIARAVLQLFANNSNYGFFFFFEEN